MRATKPAYAIHFMIYNTYLAKGENDNIYYIKTLANTVTHK